MAAAPRWTLLTALLLVPSLSVSSLAAKEPVYSMADLTALESRGSYEELLAHVEDVPPSARGADWDGLLVRGATGYIAQLSASSASYDAFWTTEALVQRYPSLRASAPFMTKRAEVGKTALDRCFQRSDIGQGCLDNARDFIAVVPADRDLAAAVGRIVRLHQNHYAAVPFFRAAVTGTTGSAVCSDPGLKLAVMAGLGLEPENDLARQAREVAVTCYGALRSDIHTATFATSTYTKANASAVVKTMGGR